jgi:hypothetical protein
MVGLSTGASVALLDWHLGGATPTRPSTRAVGLSLGTPSSVSASEMATGEGVTRQTVVYSAAVAAGQSAVNSNAFTFGPFSSARTVVGLQVWDHATTGNGTMWWYGTLATARTLGVGDSLVFNASSLVHTLT